MHGLPNGQGPHITGGVGDLDASLCGVPACVVEEERRCVETRDARAALCQAVGDSPWTAG
jgi:hypothetical protein